MLHESKSVALSKIFAYVSPDCSSQNVWAFIRSEPMKKLCEKYIIQCQMDVRTPLNDTTTLAALIGRGIALQYCFEQIEQNLELLQLQESYNHLNVLHILIRHKQLTFVEALYRKHGSFVREMFEVEENDSAYELLRQLTYNKEEQGVAFVLEHHRAVYTKDMAKLRQFTVMQHGCGYSTHGKVLEIIVEAVPELREDIDTIKQNNASQELNFYEDLRQLRERFTKTVTRLEANGKRLGDYLDHTQRTFLHAAVSWCDKGLVEKLLARNMDVMRLDANGCLPIHLVHRYESIFQLLLNKNEAAQLAYVKESGHNLLHISCRNGLHGTVLKQLVDHGMDVNGPTPDGVLPLALASCCATVTFLLDNGARLDLLNGGMLASNLSYMNYCAAIELIPRLMHLSWFRDCAHIYLTWMIGTKGRDFFSCSNQSFLESHPDIRRLLFDSLYQHSK
uniref:ANK_REP_REGION domain-containing protein n=1 Tax=Anopheles maculatus TaxID=74869 RepID=A0A182SA09_9DIPT